MSGREYLVVAALCVAYLGARAATQPASFDFDASAHLGTIAQVRQFGGLAPAERFPEIVFDLPRGVTYHHLPPLPYLLMAGVTASGTNRANRGGRAGSRAGILGAVCSGDRAQRGRRRAQLAPRRHRAPVRRRRRVRAGNTTARGRPPLSSPRG